MTHIDEKVLLWINSLVGKSAVLDRIMIWLANDYFILAVISLILLALWFVGEDMAQRESYHRAIIVAAVSMGSACGFVMAANHLYHHPHPFTEMPQLMDTVNRIFYPIHDPAFPSNTSAVTFAAAASLWQKSHKIGALMLIPAILMPFAKVYAAVYWPSDVVAGAILGVLTAYFIKWIMPNPLFEWITSLVFKILRKICLA
jgi:undecaprenyl-diphosphatase